MYISVSDPKPGRSLVFEPCAVQFPGRPLLLAKYAVATLHPAAFSALHFAARDVVAPTAAYVLDFCRAFGLLLLGAARPLPSCSDFLERKSVILFIVLGFT